MNKKLFFIQAEEIVSKTKDITMEDFNVLYNLSISNTPFSKGSNFVDQLVKKMSGITSTDPLISWNFLATEVGKAILKVKFEIGSDLLFVPDVVKLLGKTRQHVSNLLSSQEIKSEKREGKVFTHDVYVHEYLVNQGIETIRSIEKNKEFTYDEAVEKIINSGYEREEEYK